MQLLLLCCLCFVLEIRAKEATQETVYRLKSRSVCLDAGVQPPYEHGKWSYGEKRIASEHSINPEYERKIIFYKKNATLCIKNLTAKDKGIYIFAYEKNYTNINKKYNLLVEDAVPKPALSIRVERLNASTGLCAFTVNCSIGSDWLWTECDKDGCQTTHESFAQLNISVSTDNRTVTCTGNNHVSSQEDSQDLSGLCFSPGRYEVSTTDDLLYIIVPIIVCIVTFVFVFIIIFILTRHKKQPQIIQSQPLEQQPRASTSSSLAEASYENVDPQISEAAVAQSEQEEKSSTIYCVLEPIPDSASKHRAGSEETEDRGHDQIHTVYSVIKKHKF